MESLRFEVAPARFASVCMEVPAMQLDPGTEVLLRGPQREKEDPLALALLKRGPGPLPWPPDFGKRPQLAFHTL